LGEQVQRSEPPNSCLPTRTERSGVRAQRGRSEPSERRSFLTAENPIGAVVFTYFNINYCQRQSRV